MPTSTAANEWRECAHTVCTESRTTTSSFYLHDLLRRRCGVQFEPRAMTLGHRCCCRCRRLIYFICLDSYTLNRSHSRALSSRSVALPLADVLLFFFFQLISFAVRLSVDVVVTRGRCCCRPMSILRSDFDLSRILSSIWIGFCRRFVIRIHNSEMHAKS